MKKKTMTVLGVILALILLLGLAGFGVAKHYLGKIDRIDHQEIEVIQPGDESFETDEPGAPVEEDKTELETAEKLNDEDLINILLVGQDTRTGKRARSDSMILCSLNPKTKELSLISFLRDTYVKFPTGYSNNRLNAAYCFGGFPMLYGVLEENFGVHVDGGIEVDFEGFEQIIDLLGGVDISLTQGEADWLGLPAGMNHMDGKTALNYARIRKLDSDFGRTQRQRNVLTALFNKFKGSDLSTIMDLADRILGMVRTDMSDGALLKLVTQTAPVLSQLQLSTHHVPADDAYQLTTRRGMSVLVPNMAKIHEDLKNEYLPLG